MTQAVLSDKVKTLVAAATRRWPDIYDDDVCARILNKVHELDITDQVYATRYYLLEAAAYKCCNCTECSLHGNRCCGAVWGDGLPTAKIFVIGEGPGVFEQRTCTPFTHTLELEKSYCYLKCQNFGKCYTQGALANGDPLPECAMERKPVSAEVTQSRMNYPLPKIRTAAEYLNKAIDGKFNRNIWNNGQVEKHLSDLYITNLVKCRSVDKQGEDAEPKSGYITSCAKWLHLQLTIVQPEIVIALGSAAAKFIFEKKELKITQLSGQFGPRHEGQFSRLPVSVKYLGVAVHPSYTMHQYDQVSEAAGDKALGEITHVFECAAKAIGG